MNIGDAISFDDGITFDKARRAAQGHAKKYKVVFTSRKGYQDGVHTGLGGTIWRVE